MLGIEDTGIASTAYREIKRRIVDLHYEVGEKLSEARLADDLGVARSSIRAALVRLKSEGWIEISPQSGTYIRALSLKEIREVADLRMLLEARAAHDAATRIPSNVLNSLRVEFIEQEQSINSGDADAFITIDSRLHAAIYDATDNSLIRSILLDLRDKVQWIRRMCAVSDKRIFEGYGELERLLIALERRDPANAEEAMRDHVKNAASFCEQIDNTNWRYPRAVRHQLQTVIQPYQPGSLPRS